MNVGESIIDNDAKESLLGKVAEEYFLAAERGEHPSLSIYAERYPEIAAEILTLFPALAIMGDSLDAAPANTPPRGERPLKELGDYRLIREIGRGGMGIVYEAEQLSLGRRVAVKVLPFAGMLDERQLQRFKNEARAAATLHHPHIVPVYSVGCERGVHYYAMQLIEGQSLAEAIACKSRQLGTIENGDPPTDRRAEEPTHRTEKLQSERLPSIGSSSIGAISQAVAETCRLTVETKHLRSSSTLPDVASRDYFATVARLGIEAAEALGHAHQHGIIHRDVKPANLMLDNDGKLWITDLGLAQFETDIGLTRTGDVVGTLNYMSPEQALGQGVIDQRSDVYSLGATLYELATLQPPFPSADRNELLRKISSQEPLWPRLVNRYLPVDLETIICKAISKDAADRYPSAMEFAKDLRRFVEHQPIHARPAGPIERLGKWSRRHLGVVWTLLLAALMGTALLAVSTVLISRSRSGMQAALQEAALNQQQLSESLYAADMRLAGQAWQEHDPLRAVELLDQHRPRPGAKDVRDLEWYFLRSRCGAPGVELARTGAPIYDFAFSPNGRQLAVVGKDAVLRLYDWPSMAVVDRIATDQGEINGVAFSDDDGTVATVGDNGELRLWKDSGDPTPIAIMAHVGRAYDVVYSKRLKCWITCGEDGAIRLFDRATGDSLGELSGHPGGVTALAASNSGKILASAGRDDLVRLWNLDDKSQITKISRYKYRTTTMAFDDRDEALILGGVAFPVEANLLRYDLRSGKSSLIKFSAHKVSGVVISPDRRFLTIASDGGVISRYKLNAKTLQAESKPAHTWHSHQGELHRIGFAPDGSRLVSAGEDGVLRAWDETVGEAKSQSWSPSEEVVSIDAVSSLPLVVVAGPHGLHVVDVRTGELIDDLAIGNYQCVDASPDGSLIAAKTVSHDVSVWERSVDGYELLITHHLPYTSSGLQLSPNNATLAVWNTVKSNGLHLIDWKTGEEHSECLASGCLSFDWSPDGTFFTAAATGSDDVMVFDAQTCRERWRHSRHASSVISLAVSADSKLIASADDSRLICVWDATTGKEVWSNTLGAAAQEWSYAIRLQFSPAGRTLFSLHQNAQLTAWNVATGREMLRMEEIGHSGKCVTVCCDGRYICLAKNAGLRVIDTGYGDAIQATPTQDVEEEGVSKSTISSRTTAGDSPGQ